METTSYTMHRARDLAKSWLEAVREGRNAEAFAAELAQMDPGELADELNRDAAKLAFWINVYNAAAQGLLSPPPPGAGRVRQLLHALQQYRHKGLIIAGRAMSLNDIEHGLLRRSRLWWSPNLNCAAHSCPPIRSYRSSALDEQLDLAAAAYLEATVRWDASRRELELPALLQMFRADFGGKAGVLRFVSRYRSDVDADEPLKIRYQPFDTAYKPRHFA
jgi:hypothetical protein